MQIGAIILAVVSFTVGVFLWSKYGIRRGDSHRDKYFNDDNSMN